MKPTGQTPHRYGVALAQIALISILICLCCLLSDAADAILLAGRVTSSAGAALAGVPVRAQRENSNIIVTVFSDGRGEYSFPAWSNISAGTYSVAIVLPDYERVQRDAVVLNSGKTARVDFLLQPRQPSYTEALIYGGWRSSIIGVFDPRTEKFTEYPTLTPGSGPRRGDIDSKDHYWTSLYWAGRIAVFDPNNGQIKEFPLIPDVKPYGAPYLAPYRVSVDNKHQLAWTTDFNSSRLYRFDIKTEKTTEYYMPLPFEARDIKADNHADRQTVWFPAYRPPSKVVRVEVW